MKKLLATFMTVAALVLVSGCSAPGTSSGPNLTCANKVVQEITTNQTVSGTWACFTSKFQGTLSEYVSYGLLISADDAVFTDGTNTSNPNLVSTKYMGQQNGVDVYTVVVKGSDKTTLHTVTIMVWVDSSGKVDNVGIGIPLF